MNYNLYATYVIAFIFSILFMYGNKPIPNVANNLRFSSNLLDTVCISTNEQYFANRLFVNRDIYLKVFPQGTLYSTEEIVKDILLKDGCNYVTNIRSQVSSGGEHNINTKAIGYFEKGNSDFPFESGVVMSTGPVEYVPGPYQLSRNRGLAGLAWRGDQDVNEAIASLGGGPHDTKRTTQLEFEFKSMNDSLQFQYLFASNSYNKQCVLTCNKGALFIAWLIDTETNSKINIAKIGDRDLPITLSSIRNANKAGVYCTSENEDLYWRHNFNSTHFDSETLLNFEDPTNPDAIAADDPETSSIDFTGYTHPLKSKKIKIVAGRKYKIKFMVIDFCISDSHSSGVFFNAEGFNIGSFDLGKDLLVATNNALCYGEKTTINTNISESQDFDFTWYKNNEEIIGQKNNKITIDSPGIYKVKIINTEMNCIVEDELKVEFYQQIDQEDKINNLLVCTESLMGYKVSLREYLSNVYPHIDWIGYDVEYYSDIMLTDIITDFDTFVFNKNDLEDYIYVKVTNKNTGCIDKLVLKFKAAFLDDIPVPDDISICNKYILPVLPENQSYFVENNGKRIKYFAGDVLKYGIHQIIIQQDFGGGCFKEINFFVDVKGIPNFNEIEDQYMNCEIFILPKLNNHIYSAVINGKRTTLQPGTEVRINNLEITVEVKAENNACKEEYSFIVNYSNCPLPKGFSPNGDGINDAFNLSSHGVNSIKVYNRYGSEVYSYSGNYTNQWKGQGKEGQNLPSGTYFYVIQAFDRTRTGWVEIMK